jgi:hypothetical protein
MTCIWCGAFARKRFCKNKCRYQFHRSLALYGKREFEAAKVPVSTLRELHAAYTAKEKAVKQ